MENRNSMQRWKQAILKSEQVNGNKDVAQRRHFNDVLNGGDNPNGFMTKCWGPPLWFSWHIMSLNYHVDRKSEYIDMLKGFMGTLPCKSCRDNLPRNLKVIGYDVEDHEANDVYESRMKYTYFVFELHNAVNEMLGKEKVEFYQAMAYYEGFRATSCKDIEKEGCKSNFATKVTICPR
jgi:hypothetical protein